MGEADLQDDVRELRKQVEALRDVLGKVAEPYREIAGYLDELQTIARGYFRLLDLYAKHGAVSGPRHPRIEGRHLQAHRHGPL